MRWVVVLEAALAIPVLLAGVDSKSKTSKGHAHDHEARAEVPDTAIAVLHPTKGNDQVQGWVKFRQLNNGVEITAEVKGLTPGKHGFHIHEFGDLTAADGSSAGGHFNPTGEEHGGPNDHQRHAGDLGNLEANQNGTATFKYTDKMLDLHTVFGRSVVVHAGEDDLKSQPSGDSGARVAVGVIGVAQKKSEGSASSGAAKQGADTRPAAGKARRASK